MDANTVLHELTTDVKDRINYLVYKDICRKENITVRDLEIAYEYARVNVTMVEESQTPMLELFLLAGTVSAYSICRSWSCGIAYIRNVNVR